MKSEIIIYSDMKEHEYEAIRRFGDLVPEENFMILCGINAKKENSNVNREIDVLLVCPMGIFILEMKNYYGKVIHPISINDRNIYSVSFNGTEIKAKNPIHIADEQSKIIGDYISKNHKNIKDLKLRNMLANNTMRVYGTVFFTDETLDFTVNENEKLFIYTPLNIKDLWEKDFKVKILNERQINEIINIFGVGEGVIHNTFKQGDKIQNYEIISLIKDDKLYKSYKARDIDTDEIVFIKSVKINLVDEERNKQLVEELGKRDKKTGAKLKRNPYVLSYLATFQQDNYLFTLSEWEEHITLKEYIEKDLITGKEKFIISQVVDAIDNIHSKTIYHRDINDENIIILEDESIKLINFDYAKLADNQTIGELIFKESSDRYKAPEVYGIYDENKSLQENLDYYSLGVMLYKIFTKNYPYSTLTQSMQGKFDVSKINIENKELIISAISKLLSVNEDNRALGYKELKEWLAC